MTTADSRSLISLTGWGLYPVAFIARLPFAMMVVGVLSLVVDVTGSVRLGGLTSAAVGIGVVAAGPFVGAAVDRFGQRRILVPLGVGNGILLALFPLVLVAGRGEAAVLALAVAIGLSAPQASAMSRSRLMAIVRTRIAADRRSRTLSRVMSYESAVDETAFVIGPFLVGVLAALIAPWAPIAVAALLSLVFVTAFALHPSGRTAVGPQPAGTVVRAPLSALFSGRLLVLVGATAGVGMFFGSTLTSLTAFAQSRAEGVEAGLLYGLMGIGSAALALGVALLPPRFALRHRWLVFAGVLSASAAGYAAASDLSAVVAMLLVMGLGVGPVLVTVFTVAGERSPLGRTATTMTVLGSALTLAQALSSAMTGAIAESGDVDLAMLLPLVSASGVLTLGAVNVAIERRQRRRWGGALEAAGRPSDASARRPVPTS